MKDYYKILEVREDASVEVISKAYKALCAKYHPDKQPLSRRVEATAKMQELNQAYSILSDLRKRNVYDQNRKVHLLKLFWDDGLIGLAKHWLNQ